MGFGTDLSIPGKEFWQLSLSGVRIGVMSPWTRDARRISYDRAGVLLFDREEVPMKLHPSVWPILMALALSTAGAQALPVSHLEVRIVTGAQELSAGSSLELRIYEAGKSVRRLPLVHGEAWPRDSTHIIPVKMSEPLDPRD